MYESSNSTPFEKSVIASQKGIIFKEQIATKRYLKRLLWIVLFTLVLASSYLIDKRPASISLNHAFLALGITWMGILPSMVYLLDRNRSPMPFLPLVGLFYATSFGLPIFSNDQQVSSRWSLANVSLTALTLALMGVAGLNIGFLVAKSSLWKRVSPIYFPRPYPLKKLLTLLWIMLLLHIAFIYLPFIQKIPSVGQILDPVGYVAYGMFYVIGSRGKLPFIQNWILLLVCVPLEIVQRLVSGSLAQLMLLGLFLVIIIWYERKRIPILLISVTLLFLLSFNSIKGEYRYLTWAKGKFANLNAIEKVQLFVNLAIKQYQVDDVNSGEEKSSALGSVVGRTAHIVLLSEVVKDTPSKVSYWGGETYLSLFTSYIPRFLWLNKPKQIIGNSFGRRYNYLGSNDFTTSLNLPWIVEMYANFGSLGILIGMPLIGFFLAFLEQKLNQTGMSSLEFVIGATVLFRLIYQESNFSLMVGSVLSLVVTLFVIFKVFLGKSSPVVP